MLALVGGERLGNETSDPIFLQCEMRSRTGTSALSPLFRCVIKSANRKSIFLSVNIFLKCIIITQVFDRLVTLLSEFMSVLIIINISQRKLHKFCFSLKFVKCLLSPLDLFFLLSDIAIVPNSFQPQILHMLKNDNSLYDIWKIQLEISGDSRDVYLKTS